MAWGVVIIPRCSDDQGIAEMMRLGRKMGAQESTFSGLAGIGI